MNFVKHNFLSKSQAFRYQNERQKTLKNHQRCFSRHNFVKIIHKHKNMLSNNILKFEVIIISLNGYKRYILSIICPDAPVKYYSFIICFVHFIHSTEFSPCGILRVNRTDSDTKSTSLEKNTAFQNKVKKSVYLLCLRT